MSRKKVILGFNYSVDSIVALFLLKKLDLDVICIYADSIVDEQQANKNKRLKKFADYFSCTFYASNIREVFFSEVHKPFISARSQGSAFDRKIYFQHLLYNNLLEKMLKLGADYMASGVYAKIHPQSSSIFSSNLEDEDESHLLSTLDSKVLSFLNLPLGDLSKKEVDKIFERIIPEKLKSEAPTRGDSSCFENQEDFFKSYLPESFQKKGVLLYDKDEEVLGAYENAYKFEIGKPLPQAQLNSISFERKLKQHLRVTGINSMEGKISCGILEKWDFPIRVEALRIEDSFDRTTQIEVYAKVSTSSKKYLGVLRPRGFKFFDLIFETEYEGIAQNEIITIYERSKRPRVIMCTRFLRPMIKMNAAFAL